MSGTHEDFARQVRRRGSSNRNFGMVMGGAFLVVALLPLRHRQPVRSWALLLAAAISLTALLRPGLLQGANRIWTQVGLLLGKLLNPIVTALLFFLVFTPVAMILRCLRKDLLALRLDPDANTYWNPRAPSGSGMLDQF